MELFATASARVDPAIKALGDIDTAMVTLITANGTQCHISNSRRAVYGYDQRLEAFGSQGMLLSDNHRPTTLQRFDAVGFTDGQRALALADAAYQSLANGQKVSCAP